MPTAMRFLLAAVWDPGIVCKLAVAILRGNHDARQKVLRTYLLGGFAAQLLPLKSRSRVYRFASDILMSEFHRSMMSRLSSDEYARSMSQGMAIEVPELFHVVCRAFRPRCVVETGVGPGVSSAYILRALHDNDFGRLYSVDMPDRERKLWQSVPAYRKIAEAFGTGTGPASKLRPSGSLVSELLKTRWSLEVGLSSEILPGLLRDLGEVDIFLHDSEHTYENMLFEYRCAWPYLRKGGLLISHDIHWNNAFRDFAREVDRKPITLTNSLGGIVKK